MFTQNIFNPTKYSDYIIYCPKFKDYRFYSNNSNNKNILLTLISSKDIQHQSLLKNIANKKLVSNNLANELKNKYWQETVFLSLYQPLSNEYLNSLKSNGISVSSNPNRKFLLNLSRALQSNRMTVSTKNVENFHKKFHKNHYVQYTWKKGFNLPISLKLFKTKQNVLIESNRVKDNRNLFLQKMEKAQLPLFTVINQFNQIILAEHPKKNISHLNPLDQIYKTYSSKISLSNDYQQTYEGLFFINPKDALEYRNFISYKYKNIYSENKINVIASTLKFYYDASRENSLSTSLRLIPDLTELGNLLSKYYKLNHLTFHPKQKYGYNYFQGQPIYLIQPTNVFNRLNNKKENYRYFYKNSQQDLSRRYEAIFLNYNTAIVAWQKFIEQNQHYQLPKKPNMIVYNLQDYIKQEIGINKDKDYLFIPSEESFNAIKYNEVHHYNNSLLHALFDKLLCIRIFTKRIIWSLTSKQPGAL